jgi:hypothetical protein
MSTTTQTPTISPAEGLVAADAGPAPADVAEPSATSEPILLVDRGALKALMKEAVFEVLMEQRELLGSIVWDAWEDRALAAAMDEGMESEDVPVEEILKTLEEMRCAS